MTRNAALRRAGPPVVAGLALLLGGITIWYAWVVARHLRDDARQTSTLLGRVFAGLNDPRPDAATDALLDLARQVRSLSIAIVVMDTAGHITALDNAPPQIGADTARLRAWIAQLDVENAPLVQPGVGTIHYGTGTAARRFASIAALEGAVLLCLALLAGWAYRSQVAAARDRLWVAMARESAHQLGTPLMSLTGWIAYLRENPGTTGVELAEHLQADAERLERVAKRFERIGRPARREPVGLGALAERVVSYFRPRLPTLASPVTLALRATGPGPTALGDPVLLEWALEAVIKNAIDALSGRGGRIDVAVDAVARTARLSVRDEGPGVAPAVGPSRILAVTFTNKAAGEMRARVAALLGADPRGLWIGTFHALSARLLRREAALLGFGPNFTIYDQDDSESFIKRLMEQRGHSAKANPPRAIHAIISSAKNRMILPEELGASADGPLERVAAEIYAGLGPALRQANAMDFDDLLLFPLTLFAEHPERLAYWQRRFDHVLVDEFQDTNAAQYRLVKQLAMEHRNLCVVGDDDQAIYGWRGADVRHMLSFQQDFPGTILIKLEQNYRSTQVILDAANGVIAENAHRLGKTLFTAQHGGEPVTLLTAADERDEAEWLAAELSRRASAADLAYQGMAILYRTNAQSRPFEEALRFRGIPYRLVGAVSFYERREVKDVLAYLRLIANPSDDEAFARIVNVPL